MIEKIIWDKNIYLSRLASHHKWLYAHYISGKEKVENERGNYDERLIKTFAYVSI